MCQHSESVVPCLIRFEHRALLFVQGAIHHDDLELLAVEADCLLLRELLDSVGGADVHVHQVLLVTVCRKSLGLLAD